MNKIFRVVWNQATQSWVAVSELTKAHKKQSSSNSLKAVVGTAAVLLSINTAQAAVAIGETNANNTFTQSSAQATGDNSVAIGKASKATAASAVALGEAANANQARAIAIGKGATISSGQDTIAIGTDTNVQGNNSIVIGKNAKITNGTAEGTLVIGRDAFSEGSGNGARPNTVVGRGAYTAFGENGTYRLNAATALGFQAGAGLRTDPNNGNKLVNNETNADSNENVLVKAGYGLQNIQDAAKKVEMDKTKAFLQAGFAHNGLDKTGDSGKSTDIANGLSFYRKNHINEATAIGAEARAIGDQSVAIGGQVVAGDGVVALGGNDTDALRGNKYQVVTDDAVNKTKVETIDDYNLAYTESTTTVAGQYKKLVGRDMPTGYRSTYGQSGSVVIGMEAHSTTALGTAIGTNSVVRMGAFGATAIGAGSTVQTNAEAAVAIGMGSVANGAYSLAAGTASWAEYGDIALGYQAKATGKDGAIAMGRATNAQGDSSIMIGGANIASAAAQNTSYEKANGKIKNETITEIINGRPVQREYSFAGTTPTTGTVAEAYRELTGITMDVAALDFATNKNGHASTSLGVHALSKGDLGTAIGAGSRSDAIGSVALGVGAHATKQNAVAIGTGSTTELVGTRQLSVNYDSDGNIVSDNSDKIAYTFKWAGGINTSEGDVVSFGSSGAERQLKNVAAGRVAEDSTDAINGSQLNSITKKIAVGFNTSGNVVDGSSGEFTSKQKNANVDSTKKDYETAIRSLDKIQLQVGNNLKLDRNETESEIDDPDSPDKNNPLKKKIKKADFAYSLNPILTNLTSAEFKGTDANAPTTMLTNDGVTITPKTAGKSEVSLTQNGLNNGGNPITNVAGNLDGAKTGTNAPTNEAAKPANADTIKNNAATVGDVLNAGWNLKENTTAKDFVTAYDTVNFVDGNGTTVSVENTDGKTSTIKYSVNTGNGLQKDPTGNTISVKPADKSLEVTNEGVKVKAADNTLTTDANGLKVNTGTINPVNSGDKAGTVEINTNDAGKIATVDTVVNAVNKAAWNAIASKTNDGENGGTVKKQAVKAGDTVTFEADKNIKIAQDGSKFTFSTKDNVEFKSVTVGEDKDGKKPVNLTTDKATDVSNNDPANKPTTALNVSSDGKPTQITGVGSVLNTTPVTTTPDGSAPTTQPNVVNLGTAHGQTALSPNVLNSAATVRDLANMGWKVSSDKATGAEDKSYNDVVRNADEVKFVGKNAAKVSGKTVNGVRTITVDVEVPSVETAKITQNTDGSVTGPAGETLTKALKDAKDELAKLPKDADPAKVQAAKDKVDAAQKAIDDSPNSNKVATAQNVADMINASGFTLKTSNVDGGEKVSGDDEVINPGKAVEMIAGKNLTVKQEANGKVTYSTKDEVEFNTVKVGGDANTYVDDKGNPVTKKEDGSFEDAEGNKVAKDKVSPVAPVTLKTEKASPANNNAEGNHPTTALNVSSDGKPTQITGVGSTLNVKPVDTNPNGTPTEEAARPNLVDLVGTTEAPVNKNAAATVGDLQNMGWVVSTKDGNGYTDVVKNANQVDFVGKNGVTVTGATGTDGVRTITVEAAQSPMVYTDAAGNKLVKVGDKFYPEDSVVVDGKAYPAGTTAEQIANGAAPIADEEATDPSEVIASMNDGNSDTATPMTLANVKSNLPHINDKDKTVTLPDGSVENAHPDYPKAGYIDAQTAADMLNPNSEYFAGNNAATVSDVLNAGWNLQGNGQAVDFVKPFDTVNFVNGKGTKAVVETDDNLTSTVKFDVDAGEITADETKPGAVKGPVTADEAKKLAEDLAAAQKALNDLPANADDAAKKKAQDALKAAQDAAAPLNKVATAQNVADMINKSGFTLKADKTEGDNLTAADLANGEMINPGDTITMKAGKNMSVKHEKDGSITYATKDDVSFNTVNVGDNTYVDENGKPVTKDGDKYKDAKGNPVDAAKVTKLSPVAMKAEKAKPATNNGNQAEDQPTTALNVSSSDGKPTQLTGVGSTLNVKPVDTNPNGTPTEEAARPNLVDLVGTTEAPVNKNAAATVGDLQNMGWVVSTKDGNGYTDVVKNANQVDFKGDGLATVTGETKGGIRTITVNVDAQKTVEAAQNPVVYTDSEGNKVTKLGDNFYPVEEAKDAVKIGDNYYPAGTVLKDGKPVDSEGNEATALVPTDKKTVKASMNNGDNETAPTVLSNVGSNLPTVDDVKKQSFNPNDSENPLANKSNKAAPITALEAAELLYPTSDKFAGNNAATVSDVLNAGWNLQNNGEARDFVKPYDTVNFINGKGTVAVVETADDATSSTVKFDVDAGEITADTTKPGAVKGPNTTGKTPAELAKNLADAQKAVDDLAKDPLATEDAKQKAQDALKAAQDDSALLNKVATAQNVADMINASGFMLKADKTEGDNLTVADLANGEMINPGDTITMKAGKNMSVKHEKDGSITYATKDEVEFNTVKVGGDANTYVDDKGNPVTKKEDGSFEDAEGNKVAKDKVSPVAPVTLKTEKASPANNNAEGNHPTTALNVSSDGKPTQITGVGSTLNVKPVDTNPNGTATTGDARPNLVDLVGTKDAPVNKNAAATVGDLQNMGWVVSTKDGNGYKDVVKNANQVDFVGKNGITVTGETKDGIRTITVETAQSPVVYTDKAGNKLVKAGDNFYPADSVVFGGKAYPAGSVVIGGKVYPKGTTPEQVTAGTATPATALTNGKKPADVIASMNNGDDKSANAPMQLGNVAQGAETIAPVDADGNKLVKANDGKYYPAGKVKADGSLEDGTTDADAKQPLKLANDGKWYPADQISAKGVPTDTAKAVTPPAKMDPAAGLVDFANSNPNNAATVGDLQNMGWIVGAPANGYTDQVRNANKVNFVGKGIATVTGETDAEGVRTITVNVANGLVDVAKNAGTATGAVTGPKKAAEDALKAAQEELANATDDAAKKAAQDKIDAAQNAVNNAPNLVATAQNVADMINQSGWNATSAATTGGQVSGTTKELITPSETVTFEAGKNISITQAENKFTFATKDDVEFNTVKIANPNGATYTDKNNNPLVKADDGKYYPADQVENGKVKDPATATPVEADKVTTKAAPSVEFKAENATLATNNTGKDKDGKTVEPTTALNISSDDGKPTQLKGVGSVLNTADVNTSTGEQRDTDGNITPAQAGTDKLVDLGTNPKKGDKPLSEETLNSAATVRDLANMGWVVSAKDNNYTNTVKNANKVEFKGKNGISVTGKDVTQQDGTVTREITVAIAEGSVTDKVTITTKDGKEIPAIKIGDNYYSVDKDGKPVGYEVDANGKPTANNRPLDVTDAEIKNNGAGFVTGNSVATAIQESGWNVGLANTADADKAFNDADKALSATKLEKVNPNDNVRFADGKGTKAAVATVERVDEFGKKVTDTYVKFDVDAGKVEAVKDAAGNNTGAVTGPVTTALNDALTKAQEAQKALKPDATKAEKDAAQAAVDAAQAAVNNAGNQVATAQNVAEAINNSGWRTNSTTATGGAKDTLINPGKAVNFEAGKNMEVAQTVDKDGNVAYTYKTKDDVQFNSVQFGDTNGPKITNNGGNINVSGPDGKAPTKITGVAAGDISPNSTDAVNGAQIYALSRGNVPNVKNITDAAGNTYNNVIVDEKGTPILKTYNVQGQKEIITNSVVEAIYNMNEQGIKFFHSNDGVDRPKVETENSFDSSASGKFATAIGSKSSAEGTNAVAIGFNSVVTGNDSISIGTGNRVTGNNSGAFGDPSTVSGQRSYSVGNNNTVVTNDTFVLGNEVTQTVENSVILGKKSTATAGDGSATGTLNNIKQDGTKGTSTTAGSKGTVKQAIVGNMVYGGFEGATADGVVSVGAAGNERRIQNVAAGEISATSTDAINGSQLYSVAQGVGNRLGDLNNKINRNNKNLRAGIAGANAAAGLPQVYIPGKSMVAASAGTYKGQSALAVGYSRASDNGKLILKLQGNANTRGDVGGSVGVGYQW